MTDRVAQIIEFEKKLAAYQGDDRIISSDDMRKIVAEEKGHFSLKSGLHTIDDLIAGFDEGELVVISGKTGGGKTEFCLTLTQKFAEQNVNSLWFNYEMPPRGFLERLPESTVFYMPAIIRSKNLDWLERRIWEAKVKYNIKVVFVDHLHFLVDLAMMQNASLQIGQVVRQLKLMALKHNLIFFLIAHTTKINFEKDLELGDVRDSSFIEQEADTVLYVWRKRIKTEEDENRSWVKVAKNRKRGIVDKKVELKFTNKIFSEVND